MQPRPVVIDVCEIGQQFGRRRQVVDRLIVAVRPGAGALKPVHRVAVESDLPNVHRRDEIGHLGLRGTPVHVEEWIRRIELDRPRVAVDRMGILPDQRLGEASREVGRPLLRIPAEIRLGRPVEGKKRVGRHVGLALGQLQAHNARATNEFVDPLVFVGPGGRHGQFAVLAGDPHRETKQRQQRDVYPVDSGHVRKIGVVELRIEREQPVELAARVGIDREGAVGHFQAVFSLRGKPLNCFGLTKKIVYENEEFNLLQAALNIEDGLEGLRYNKVIIATDADVDGMHIRLLIITFFLQFFPDLIKNNHVFILQTPLFRVRNKKETIYCYSDEERIAAIEKLKPNPEITRFKGLGEISPGEFKNFIGKDLRLDPVTMKKQDAVKEMLEFYMGKNTMERQNFIIDNLVVEEDI